MGLFADVFTVCPPHTDVFGARSEPGVSYASLIAAHGAAAERIGASAMLIYDFWQSLDPWITAQLVLSSTDTLEPIVAVNPALTHPATAARALAGLTHLYGRRVNLNVVAGAKEAELAALGLPARGEERHPRLAEFIDALHAVLESRPYHGRWNQLDTAPLEPPPDPALAPRIIAPGSSSPGAAEVLGRLDRALVMAKPRAAVAAEHQRLAAGGLRGGLAMIVGIVARETADEAWKTARGHYAGSRRDALTSKVFARTVTSTQHAANLSAVAAGEVQDDCLWYGSDRIGMDCPKLVGSYPQVAAALRAYREAGVTTLVLDLPFELAEYEHIDRALCAPEQHADTSDPRPERRVSPR